jgi:putative nucleotidyltransferase with HDIG domain
MAKGSRILLICDDKELSRHLEEQLIVEGGYFVCSESGANAGLAALRQNNFDVVIAKFGMPDLDSVEFVRGLKKIDPDCIIIVLLQKPDALPLKGLASLGIYDSLSTPVNPGKLFFLIEKGAELHSLMIAGRKLTEGLKEHNIALEKQNTLLTGRMEESTRNLTRLYEDLRTTYMHTIKVLAQAIDARDHFTHSHSENVAKYAVAIADQMGLSTKEIGDIREACALHDLGKIAIEDHILSKPMSLTPQEWKKMKLHTEIGAKILEPLTFLRDVTELVRQHHEHFDGSGYPEGRKGEDILLGARIIHLADAYEAMRSARAYRKTPLTKEEAIREIKSNTGTQFDPTVVEAFLKVVDRL